MNREVIVERSPNGMVELMRWCADNGIPVVNTWLNVELDGSETKHYHGHRQWLNGSPWDEMAVPLAEALGWVLLVRERDYTLFTLRFN